MSKPFTGKISNVQVYDHPLTTREILIAFLKPVGLAKLNPLSWWRWFRVRSYADHVHSLNPSGYWPMDEEEEE